MVDVKTRSRISPVLRHEGEVRLDMCTKCGWPSRFGKNARDYVGPASFDDLDHDLSHEVVFAGEVADFIRVSLQLRT